MIIRVISALLILVGAVAFYWLVVLRALAKLRGGAPFPKLWQQWSIIPSVADTWPACWIGRAFGQASACLSPDRGREPLPFRRRDEQNPAAPWWRWIFNPE